jgi:hypothetical protein
MVLRSLKSIPFDRNTNRAYVMYNAIDNDAVRVFHATPESERRTKGGQIDD